MQSVSDYVAAYAAAKWSIFPIRAGKKFPPLTPHGHLDATSDIDRLQAMFLDDSANIGLNVGVSDFVVVDIDPRNNAIASIKALPVNARLTMQRAPRSKTANEGWHLFFRAPKGERARSVLGNGGAHVLGPGIDVKAGSSYVLVPPSRLTRDDGSEGVYTWDRPLLDFKTEDIPEFPSELLDLLTARKGTPTEDRALLASEIRPHPSTLPNRFSMITPSDRTLPTRVAERFQDGGVIRVGERDASVFWIACELLGNGWNAEEAMSFLFALLRDGWLESSVSDQFSLEDVRKKVASAQRKVAQKQQLAATPSGASGLTTMAELLARSSSPASWLVDELLIDGGTSLLCAKPKVGKSTLARELALCVARGAAFLGRTTRRGDVVYIDFESNEGQLRKAFLAMGATAADSVRFHADRAPNNAIAWLAEIAASIRPALIIVDTLQRLTRVRDVNDYAAVTNALDPITHIARKSGAHLMLLHHAKKAGGENGDAVLGSTGIFGAVDTLLEMQRRDDRRTLSSIQRYGEDLQAIVLRKDEHTERVTFVGAASDVTAEDCLDEMLDALRAQPWLTRAELLGSVEYRKEVKLAALSLGRQHGQIVERGDGKKGDPLRFAVAGTDFVVPVSKPLDAEPGTGMAISRTNTREMLVPEASDGGADTEPQSDDASPMTVAQINDPRPFVGAPR